MKLFSLVIVLNALVMLTSCSSDGEQRPEYLDSQSVKQLEVPPELTRLNDNEELYIPKPSSKALLALNNMGRVEGQVALKFKGLELQSDAGMHSLLLQMSADEVWPLLHEFLAHEGIKIERHEPLMGFIETEWLKDYENIRDKSYLKRIFNLLSADNLDKFRLRVESITGQSQTRLTVSHRGLENIVTEDGSSWQQTVPNQMLERELLFRLTLFAGITQEKAEDIFAHYQPYQARIRQLGEAHSSLYEVTGSKQIVWQRIIQALDRMAAEIKVQDMGQVEQSANLQVLVGRIKNDLLEERDEISESSWLMNALSNNKEVSQDKLGRISIYIALKEINNSTQMQLSLENNQPMNHPLASKFEAALIGLLK